MADALALADGCYPAFSGPKQTVGPLVAFGTRVCLEGKEGRVFIQGGSWCHDGEGETQAAEVCPTAAAGCPQEDQS